MALDRRQFLQSLLAVAASTLTVRVAQATEAAAELGAAVTPSPSPLFIGLDIAQGEDAAVAVLCRLTPAGVEILEHARLAKPVSQEQVTAWVRLLAEQRGVTRFEVRGPRLGEMEAWRSHSALRAAEEIEQGRWADEYRTGVERRIALQQPRPLPRRERLRAAIRARLVYGGEPGGLVELLEQLRG